MTDLKTLAYELLHEAQQSLESEGHLNPTAIVITADENLIVDVEFEDDEEREDIYSELVETARDKNAAAIVTINDVYLDERGAAVRVCRGRDGADLRQPANEAIVITVSGAALKPGVSFPVTIGWKNSLFFSRRARLSTPAAKWNSWATGREKPGPLELKQRA